MNRSLLPATLLAMLVALLAAPIAIAQEPQRLDGQVTDSANVLDERALQPALDAFETATGSQLHVLFVSTTGDLPLAPYVDETVELNNFGAGDALFVVAVEDRTYQLWVGDRLASSVSATEQDDILIDEVEPFLADGDYDGAVRAVASGLAAAATGSPLPAVPTPLPTQGDGSETGSSGGPNIFVVLLVLGVIVAVIWGGLKVWRRMRPASAAGTRSKQTGAADLAERANEVLLEADEAVRDASQEVSFAEAEFGTGEVGVSRKALGEAETKLNEAFRIRQQLDDEINETPAERETMLRSLIAACESAIAISEAEIDRVDTLRDLERRAEEVLASLPGQVAEATGKIATARGDLAFLEANAAGAVAEVRGNVEEAEKCVDFAEEQIEDARASLPAGEAEPSAPAIRAAQAALAEADRLSIAISELRSGIETAREALPGDLRAAEAAINAARSAGSTPAPAAGSLSEAERLLREARELGSGTRADPVTARARAVQARSLAESVTTAARSEHERQQQLRATTASSIASARTTFDRAQDYIQSRRMGVGSSARTRLTESRRHLDEARRFERSDPTRASSEATAATRLAEEALRLASRDFASYDQPANSRPRNLPGSRHSTRGGDIASAGAVLADILGAGVDGSRWGTPRKSSQSRQRPPGGRSSAGSFSIPGLGRNSTSGSRPAGGGGRSRGGRW